MKNYHKELWDNSIVIFAIGKKMLLDLKNHGKFQKTAKKNLQSH